MSTFIVVIFGTSLTSLVGEKGDQVPVFSLSRLQTAAAAAAIALTNNKRHIIHGATLNNIKLGYKRVFGTLRNLPKD